MRILLYSGGLDSFIYWRLLSPKLGSSPIFPVYIPLGHRYEMVERDAILKQEEQVLGLNVTFTPPLPLGDWEQEDAHIPLRNLFLTCYAAAYPHVTDVILCSVFGESSRDKSYRFYQDTTRLVSYLLSKRVRIYAPFSHLTKTELVARYLEEGYNPDHLSLTVSCYGAGFCGKCMSCYRRWIAMTANGISEHYSRDPAGYDLGSVISWLRDVPNTDWREWPRILRNNLDAWRIRHAKGL